MKQHKDQPLTNKVTVPPANMFRAQTGDESDEEYNRLKREHDARFAKTSQEAATKNNGKSKGRAVRESVFKKIASGATYGRVPTGQ